jgi:hypothetical protein
MRFIRLLTLAVLASPLAAQEAAPRLEVGIDVSHWQLDQGTATVGPTTRQSGTVRAAVLLPSRRPASLGLSATYAPRDGSAPGLLGFGTELAQRIAARGVDDMNLFVAAGAGILRISAEEKAGIDLCRPEAGCIDEGPHQPEGWRTLLSASVGADVPVARGAMMQPAVQLLKPLGQEPGDAGVLVCVGIGLAWRP